MILAVNQARRWTHLRAGSLIWTVLGLLAASLLAAILLQRSMEESQNWVRHTLQVRNTLGRLGQGVLGAESGQRGFLLTREERYLSLYRDESAVLRGTLGLAVTMTADNPSQQVRLAMLGTTQTQKLEELEETITLATAGRWDAALALVRTDRGRQLSERMLAQLAELDAEEVRLLSERESAAARLRAFTIAAMALALLAAGGAAVLETRRQNATLRATRALNAELDERVRLRTASLEQALAMNRALTEEVHHRAGNGLTLVASFLSLQANELDGEAAEALEEARRRVVALASAQRRLRVDTTTGSADLAPYLKGVLDDIRAAVGGEVSLHYDPPAAPIIEPSGIAVSIGVIAGEMITNAIKHAFPQGMHGQVTLRLSTEVNRILVQVEDDGVGLAGVGLTGLGSRVLPALAELLGGTLHRGPARGSAARPGTLCSLMLPMTPPPEHQPAP